jgi:hypothetical protein
MENHGVGLDYYVSWLRENNYQGFTQYLPHDVEVRELGTGRSRKEVLEEAGLSITVAPRLSIADGIQAVRRMLPRCWFDHKTKPGLDALRNYRREYNEKQQVFYDKPKHDWCFTGDTKILTRYGMQCIMNLPITGEVLTSCGWKQYTMPRITRKNAQLVQVVFKDGHSVRCTPDHLFKTVNGWKSAECLTKGLRIQSTLTRLHNISMAVYIESGLKKFIFLGAVRNFIERFGGKHLEKYQMAVISIIRTAIQPITQLKTWSVCKPLTTGNRLGLTEQNAATKELLLTTPEKRLLNGTSQRKADFGISAMQKDHKGGLNGSALKRLAQYATQSLTGLSARMATAKFIARIIAKPLIIEDVKPLDYLEDVWCLTVEDVAEFSLINGALVHNCSHYSDAFRYLAISLDESDDSWSSELPIKTNWIV